jgi:outer membrane protein TolC
MRLPDTVYAQDTLLTFQQALEISLNNNYELRVAGNEISQAMNNDAAGNAGMLPSLDANASYTKSSNSLDQKYTTGTEVNRTASATTNTSANLVAGWTVFDGLKMFYTKEKLSQLSLQARDAWKVMVENTLIELVAAYYSLVKQQQLLQAIREEIRFAEEREKIAERKLLNGSGSRLDLLLTRTELNRQRSLELSLRSDAEEARIRLNRLMARPVEDTYRVEDTVIISYRPEKEALLKSVTENNSLLSYYRRSQRIAELGLSETKALRSPVVRLNAGYSYSKTNSEAGFILFNKTDGFNYGITATLPLFRGFTINQQVKNSRLEMANAGIAYQSATDQTFADLYNSWRAFDLAREVLKIEEQNITYAREVLSVAQERYRVGVSNNSEVLDAQRTYEEAMSRLAGARYDAKISEAALKKVNGELIIFGEAVKE